MSLKLCLSLILWWDQSFNLKIYLLEPLSYGLPNSWVLSTLGFSAPSVQLRPLIVHFHFSRVGAIGMLVSRQIVGDRASRFWHLSSWSVSPLNKLLLKQFLELWTLNNLIRSPPLSGPNNLWGSVVSIGYIGQRELSASLWHCSVQVTNLGVASSYKASHFTWLT